jgi:ABC-type branched-subunit amino acid transport system ATPase component
VKLLHYVEIENFKRYADKQHIELEHPAVLIGPNNCGKTSVLQAIALWSIGLRTWQSESENSKAEKKPGKPLNRLNILSVPVPKTRHFWNNLRVSKRELRITVGVDVKGTAQPVTMIFRHHASDELVYCEPAPESLTEEKADAFRAACALDVALLYPMSGISADEAVVLPQRIEFFLGRGSTAEVLRNICLQVLQQTPGDWREISDLMRRLFHVEMSEPKVNEKGGVDLAYSQVGTGGEMDLGLSGRGFQQMLLIFAHLYLHKGCVLLIDEPDAHLEILRQQQVYVLLRDIAHRNGCQVVIVTHSEVLLREALDKNLTLILQGRVENLAQKEDIRATLKHFGAEHYVRAKETGHVLYVEGGTDMDMLRAFALKTKHPASSFLEDGGKLNVYYLQDNFPDADRSTDEELQRVEGGYGLKAEQHFNVLKRMIPALRGLSIQDNDGKGRADGIQNGLNKLVWKRYEAENYFISPELLLAAARQQAPEGELFHGA